MTKFEIIKCEGDILDATLYGHLKNLKLEPTNFKLRLKYLLSNLGFELDYPSRVMADLHDLYQLGAKAAAYENNQDMDVDVFRNISSIRQIVNCTDNIMMSNLYVYDSNSLEATIIDNDLRLNKKQPRKVLVPEYSNGANLIDVLSSQVGLKYLQTLFNTQDDALTMGRNLSALTGLQSNLIKIWTPTEKIINTNWYNKDFKSNKSGAITVIGYCNNVFHFLNNFRSDFKCGALEKIN